MCKGFKPINGHDRCVDFIRSFFGRTALDCGDKRRSAYFAEEQIQSSMLTIINILDCIFPEILQKQQKIMYTA